MIPLKDEKRVDDLTKIPSNSQEIIQNEPKQIPEPLINDIFIDQNKLEDKQEAKSPDTYLDNTNQLNNTEDKVVDTIQENIEESKKSLLEKIKDIPDKISQPSTITHNSNDLALSPADIKLKDDLDKILEENISVLYSKLNDSEKIKFSLEKEKVLEKIFGIIKKYSNKLQKFLYELFKIIFKWLKITKIDTAYLEKEAKIKIDKIIKLNESLNIEEEKK